MKHVLLTVVRMVALGVGLSSLAVQAADGVNPNQAEIDALNHRKALLEARSGVAKAENALAKEEFEAFPEGFGKKGTLTLSGTDNVRVAGRAALALKRAAKQIASVLNAEGETVVLLTDEDRHAIPWYRGEKDTLERLVKRSREQLSKATPVQPEAAGLLALGSMLTQIAQFTQLFRTDKDVAFVSTTLPEDLLLDLVAVDAPRVLYPAAAVDGLLTRNVTTPFATSLSELAALREELGSRKDAGVSALVTKIDEFFARLSTVDQTTKKPGLLTALRGELASGHLEVAKGRVMTVRILAQGGTTLKTSSIWRSDRYFVAGNVAIAYRLAQADPISGRVLKTDVIVSDEPYARIPLE